MSMKRPISGNNYLEQHNDDMVEELSSKGSTLKRVTIAIGDDVREQNRLLTEMDSGFDMSKGMLGTTMRRLGLVSRSGGRNVLCYLVLFAFFIFLAIYMIVKSS